MNLMLAKQQLRDSVVNFPPKKEQNNTLLLVNYSSCVIIGLVIGNLIYLILIIRLLPFFLVIYQRMLK